MIVDDEGRPVATPDRVRRVVSIVPSLTEAVALTDQALLVGATDWCTHPLDLDVERVRGTKNPDITAVVALRPDLVVANQEENRPVDLDALRAAGVPVYVTDIRTLDDAPHGAFSSLGRMLAACGLERPAWLAEAQRAWAAVVEPAVRRRAVVPIWRRPWMTLSGGTYGSSLLARVGIANAFADAAIRYPEVTLDDVAARRPDLVLLPTEPYPFKDRHRADFDGLAPAQLVDGQDLFWWGTRTPAALARLARELAS